MMSIPITCTTGQCRRAHARVMAATVARMSTMMTAAMMRGVRVSIGQAIVVLVFLLLLVLTAAQQVCCNGTANGADTAVADLVTQQAAGRSAEYGFAKPALAIRTWGAGRELGVGILVSIAGSGVACALLGRIGRVTALWWIG